MWWPRTAIQPSARRRGPALVFSYLLEILSYCWDWTRRSCLLNILLTKIQTYRFPCRDIATLILFYNSRLCTADTNTVFIKPRFSHWLRICLLIFLNYSMIKVIVIIFSMVSVNHFYCKVQIVVWFLCWGYLILGRCFPIIVGARLEYCSASAILY